jgi:hypothetical protein
MPTYAIAYVLILAALAIASWQMSERSGLAPAWLRNGDLIASAGQILLTVAFWSDGLREALGLSAVPILAALVAWLVYASRPALEIGIAMAGEQDEGRRRIHALFAVGLALVVVTPALFCGWRVALAALATT